ncbi:hypothetical protein Vadar_011700 [Vaccinium darrowii]|uniref:Uncharacterized protein n=1 Tax=Vaccinium darrowii TaxID=229202 RepID=A0ACB7XQU9_9ERIC|nr:hypothetical protein Vadar_011700 [Vaccinium darrowii]
MNVELHNIRKFEVVPKECTDYIGKYRNSVQYRVDSERAIDECTMFLSTSCSLKRDGRDAWIFYVDDTLLSTVPYFKKHHSGGEMLNLTSLEEWMSKARAPALDHTMKLFNDLKKRGFRIILVDTPFIPFGPNCTHECGQKKSACMHMYKAEFTLQRICIKYRHIGLAKFRLIAHLHLGTVLEQTPIIAASNGFFGEESFLVTSKNI